MKRNNGNYRPGSAGAVALALLSISAASAQEINTHSKKVMDLLQRTEGCLRGLNCSAARLATPGGAAVSGITVVNGATFRAGLSPGSSAVILGVNLASNTRSWTSADFQGDVLPTSLDGTRVQIAGKDAAVEFISPTQVNVLIPPDMPTGPATVTVTSPAAVPASTDVMIADRALGFFTFGPQNGRYLAAVDPVDGSLIGPGGLFGNATPTHPARAGSHISLYGTGFGATGPAQPSGLYFSDPRPIYGMGYLGVSIGGRAAQVDFAGAVSPGLYQINVVVPADLISGDYPVAADFGGVSQSQPNVFITIAGDPAGSRLQAAPSSITFQAALGSNTPVAQTLQVTASAEPFNFTIRSSQPWLHTDIASGRTPASIRISVDASSLAMGSYSGQLTVDAPGTASPTTVVPVSVTVGAPAITLSRSTWSFQALSQGSSMSIPVAVESGGFPVNFTAAVASGSFLSVSPASLTTPAVVTVRATPPTSTQPATFTGSIRITPAGGGVAADVQVQIAIVAKAPTTAAPQVLSLDYDDLVWGEEETSFCANGQNLSAATGMKFVPADGLTLGSKLNTGSTFVCLDLTVNSGAAEGTRTVVVTSQQGESNAFPFTIRRGQPQIRTVVPAAVQRNRFYTSSGFDEFDSPQAYFEIDGADLAGVQAIRVDPSDGVTALPAAGAGTVYGTLSVDPSAGLGTRKISVVSPGGVSNEFALDVQTAPANAPVISNLVLDTPTTSGNKAIYTGKFDFTDSDGDVGSSARVRMIVDLPIGATFVTMVSDSLGSTGKPGQMSGTVQFRIEQSFIFLRYSLTGKVPIVMSIVDGSGHQSNALRTTVSAWYYGI